MLKFILGVATDSVSADHQRAEISDDEQKPEFRARRAEQKHPFQYRRATRVRDYIGAYCGPSCGPTHEKAELRAPLFSYNSLV